ncbi:unnamed protein product [Ceratitis capitata]|uniref:(Mediterranean fruit fly) hypothetical protein n=1 Tax=Ceratitis capitata TaxID=7213 RepID=A0A811UG19_CERCA|nr:unnamed protein product [Ceratitis capitata]
MFWVVEFVESRLSKDNGILTPTNINNVHEINFIDSMFSASLIQINSLSAKVWQKLYQGGRKWIDQL